MGSLALVLHGGAWDIPPDLVEPHRNGMKAAIDAGWKVLKQGGSAVDAVERAVVTMENDETFDAGRGSFINAAGEVELDASIMSGDTFRAGAVAAVQNVRNPITLARRIMEKSEHVLLVGIGASRFAREQKVALCGQDDLITLRELDRWRAIQGDPKYKTGDSFKKKKHPSGTVGAVALDKKGNIASGTSTGGTPNKYPGRVGDSPLIGCGNYADNSIGGVSTSGWGEAMIKVVMAKTVVDLMEANGLDPEKAAQDGLKVLVRKVDGYGGIIALSKNGAVGIAFNTPRMARAFMRTGVTEPVVLI
jgi:beta-aspartyl-peptidase (threonine type)